MLPSLILCSGKGIESIVGWAKRIGESVANHRNPEGTATKEARHDGWIAQAATVALCIGLAWWPVNGANFARWFESGAAVVEKDHGLARRGLRIRERTPEDTVIGVLAAGAVPYFSGRRAIDLLGRSDPVIARSPPIDAGIFFPGHSKWDYEHSVVELHPDLIVGIGIWSKKDRLLLERSGYVKAPRSLGAYMTRELAERIE
jgi:hypothetical protein